MEIVITILNQEIKVDCLLIAFLMTQPVILVRKAFYLFTATVALFDRENRHIYIQHIVQQT